MNNGFGWNRLPKSFMAQNTVFLLMTALIRNFYKAIMQRLKTREFGLRVNRYLYPMAELLPSRNWLDAVLGIRSGVAPIYLA